MMRLYYSNTFSAAHYIPEHPKCGKTHGHTWKVEVWLEGELREEDKGMLLDFGDIKDLLKAFDHDALNDLTWFTDNFPPTAEHLAQVIHAGLKGTCSRRSKEISDIKVRVWESDHAYAEYN